MCMFDALGGQKRALDLLEVELERIVMLPSDCWESNSGAEEEQSVLLTIESSLWPMAQTSFIFKVKTAVAPWARGSE